MESDAGAEVPVDAQERVVDAAQTTPDAKREISVDAAVPSVDASAECTPGTSNLLGNADFDLGPGVWMETSGGAYPLITDEANISGIDADTGTYVGWLGGYTPTLLTASDVMYQDILIPTGAANLSVTGKLWIDTAETTGLPFDTMDLELVDVSSGASLESLGSWSNSDSGTSWTTFSANITGTYAGQTVRVRWKADFDATKTSSFFLDTLALTSTCP